MVWLVWELMPVFACLWPLLGPEKKEGDPWKEVANAGRVPESSEGDGCTGKRGLVLARCITLHSPEPFKGTRSAKVRVEL